MKSKISICIVLLMPVLLSGQDTKPPHVVRASGESTVTTKPDQANLSIGVVSQAATAEAVSTQNATQTTQVLSALKKLLGPDDEIKTNGYSVSPNYNYPKDGSPQKIVSYNASNNILVTINELASAGKIIDSATQAGANNITNISFRLRNDTAARTQALSEAAVKARSNADAIAKALGLTVIGIMDAQSGENGSIRPIMPGFRTMSAMQTQAPTPIESGTLDIHATVTITLQVQ